MIFIDDFSRGTWVYLLKSKQDILSIFQQFHKMIDTQFNAKVKILHIDNGGEYTSHTFSAYLSHHGILHQTTYPSTPEQNGVAKRKNHHLLEITRVLLFYMQVPKVFWVDALQTAIYLMHRMPSRVLGFRAPKDLLPESFVLSTLSGPSPEGRDR